MKFDELDSKMRVFETANDRCVLPGVHIVARIDGRGFTRLTKEMHAFDAPFDVRFRDMSDEISLLFRPNDNTFGRKTRKIVSVLAGEASAKFTLLLGGLAAFDCRVCELPTAEQVRDYFRWRSEDAHCNALGAHCYWMLRKSGRSVAEATGQLAGMSVADKNELLFRAGINFNDLPAWQKRGSGVYWEDYEKPATNPKTGETVHASRRRLRRDLELPLREAYDQLVLGFVRPQ